MRRLHRAARTGSVQAQPDLAPAVLAAVAARRSPLARVRHGGLAVARAVGARLRPRGLPDVALRLGLLAVGLVQGLHCLGLALGPEQTAAADDGHSHSHAHGHTHGSGGAAAAVSHAAQHLDRDLAAFGLALAAAFAAIALRPRRAAPHLPFLVTLVGALAVFVAVDLASGAASALEELDHALPVLGLAFVAALARRERTGRREPESLPRPGTHRPGLGVVGGRRRAA
ncbi:hypothetical protein [Motilibacter aurantiacus]|uniref:hypothetical protein n=1 Tax=Motilibacter aurantiacus TaxID=2714955 RepID=UPI001E39FDEC|nr:hypothetical protein [Motilibacter aurantiacus]